MNLSKNEKLFNVRPVGIRYICELCGKGEMKVDTSPDAQILMSNPPLIPHVCTSCGGKMSLPKQYPYIEWEEIKED